MADDTTQAAGASAAAQPVVSHAPTIGEMLWPGLREMRQQGRFQDELAKPGTDIYDPATQQRLISMAPVQGMQLVDRSAQMYQQQQQRAAQALMLSRRGLQTAIDTYTEAAQPGADGSPADYGAADQKANDMLNRYRSSTEKLYGKHVADAMLPPVWNASSAAQTLDLHNRLMAGMQVPTRVYDTATGNVHVENFIPGTGDAAKYFKENPTYQPIESSATPVGGNQILPREEAVRRGLPMADEGATYSINRGTNVITPLLGPAEVQAKQAEQRHAFESAPSLGAATQATRDTAFRNLKDSLRDAKGHYKNDLVSNLKTVVYQSQLEQPNPNLQVGESTAQLMSQQNLLSPNAQILLNEIREGKDGKFSEQTLKRIDQSTDETMSRYRQNHEVYRASQGVIEDARGWKPGTVTQGYPYMDAKEFEGLKYKPQKSAPAAEEAAPPPKQDARGLTLAPVGRATYPMVATPEDYAKVRDGETYVTNGGKVATKNAKGGK